jgi:hypothetical protein
MLCVNAACISCYAINTIHSELTFFFISLAPALQAAIQKDEREAFRFVMERALTSVFVYACNYPLCTLLSHLGLLHDEAQTAGCSESVCYIALSSIRQWKKGKQYLKISLKIV